MSANDIAVRVEGLSKVYRIGRKEKTHDTLGGAMVDFIRSPLQNYRKYRSLYRFGDVEIGESAASQDTPADIIWALRGVSFEIRHGEVVGFIGRNGAGKSTLLKILSRITPPTRGQALIRGRVSSLLEVGTGFHRELTGRENVYLNGTILGMTKKEVDRKFDEIVDFSGIERFIDTPIKRYSSGMSVRLAFAVAAHLEPEILIIDEVLAVGDAAFQQKCINKMQDVRRQGRTILFVSHNISAVKALCNKAILLNEGRLLVDGSVPEVVTAYLGSDAIVPAVREWIDPATAPKGEIARLRAVRIISREGVVHDAVDIRHDVGIQMEYEVIKPGFALLSHYLLYNEEGVMVLETLDQDPQWRRRPRPAGRYTSTAWIPGNLLGAGMYFVNCALIARKPDMPQFYIQQAVAVNVVDKMGDDTARGDWAGELTCAVRPLLEWETKAKMLSLGEPTRAR